MSGISTSLIHCNYISYNCQQGISDDVVLGANLVLCVSLRARRALRDVKPVSRKAAKAAKKRKGKSPA